MDYPYAIDEQPDPGYQPQLVTLAIFAYKQES